jgi:hypothetical protein
MDSYRRRQGRNHFREKLWHRRVLLRNLASGYTAKTRALRIRLSVANQAFCSNFVQAIKRQHSKLGELEPQQASHRSARRMMFQHSTRPKPREAI